MRHPAVSLSSDGEVGTGAARRAASETSDVKSDAGRACRSCPTLSGPRPLYWYSRHTSGWRERISADSDGRSSRFALLTTVAIFRLVRWRSRTNEAARMTSSKSALAPRIVRWTSADEPSRDSPTTSNAKSNPCSTRRRNREPLVLSTVTLPASRSCRAYLPTSRTRSGSPPQKVTAWAELVRIAAKMSSRNHPGSLPGSGP